MIDDGHLVEACLEGDARAFAVLVGRYRYPVYGLCLSYTRDFDAAEDAAQEALIAAYARLRACPNRSASAPGCGGSPPTSAAPICASSATGFP